MVKTEEQMKAKIKVKEDLAGARGVLMQYSRC